MTFSMGYWVSPTLLEAELHQGGQITGGSYYDNKIEQLQKRSGEKLDY